MLRLLVMSRRNRRLNVDSCFEALADTASVECVKLSDGELQHIGAMMQRWDCAAYDWVIVDLPFRCLAPQYEALKTIPNLVLYEEDACQNFMTESAFCGEFIRLYRRLPAAKVILTGAGHAKWFRSQGIDAHFVSKGFDQRLLRDTKGKRDIEFAFIGTTSGRVYAERRRLLSALQGKLQLRLLQTRSPEEYAAFLNRIKYFVSADVGFGEYMAKNFEAMACGCIVVAKRQGTEEEVIGFSDMDNIVLYDDISELLTKVTRLNREPELAVRLATRGLELVHARHSYAAKAQEILLILRQHQQLTTAARQARV